MSAIAPGFDPAEAWAIFHFAFRLGRSEKAWRGAVASLHTYLPPECKLYGGPCIGRAGCARHDERNN